MARCSEDAQRHRLDTPTAGRSWSGADNDDSELAVFTAERYFNEDDALWCGARSSSSTLSSSVFRTGTAHELDRSVVTTTTTAAATSSSEASWNSRSALIPEGRRALADIAPGVVEADDRGSWTTRCEEPPREKPPSHLRRWLLGVAGCACVGGHDGADDSASTDDDLCSDEVQDGVGGKNLVTDGEGDLFQSRANSKELAIAEATTSVKARPSSRCLYDGEDVIAGEAAAFSRVQLAGDDGHHRKAVKPGEFSAPTLITPATATAALLHEQRRRKSSEMLLPMRLGDTRSALSSPQQDSCSTIVAGNTAVCGALHASTGDGRGKSAARPAGWPGTTTRRCDWWSDDDDSAAPVELVAGCPYPPSEASVDWSVVTAEGVASCNFSSAASGYYYTLNGGSRPANNRRRKTNGSGLLTCMGNRAVDAVGPARRPGDHDRR